MSEARGLWRKRLGLSLASTVFALLLGECATRALGIVDPPLRDVDPVLGWAPIPGAEGWWNREGRAYVRITEHGFRGVDVPPARRPGVLRVAVLGDSYTEAKQIALEDAFPALLERGLEGCRDEPVEVLSFGVSGFGTAQEYLLWTDRVRAYQPDVVVLAVFTGNDILDNHPALRTSGDPAPYFTVEDGELTLDDDFLRSEEYRSRAAPGLWLSLVRSSHLLRAVTTFVRHRREGHGEQGLRDEIYFAPRDDRWRDAWLRTETILEHMSRDVRADGAGFFVVTLTNALQVDPDPAVRERYRTAIGAGDLLYPDQRIAALGERAGFEVLTLVPVFREHAEANHVQLHGFPNTAMGTGHWNEAGHRLAGERMTEWLCAELDGEAIPRSP